MLACNQPRDRNKWNCEGSPSKIPSGARVSSYRTKLAKCFDWWIDLHSGKCHNKPRSPSRPPSTADSTACRNSKLTTTAAADGRFQQRCAKDWESLLRKPCSRRGLWHKHNLTENPTPSSLKASSEGPTYKHSLIVVVVSRSRNTNDSPNESRHAPFRRKSNVLVGKWKRHRRHSPWRRP